METSSPALWRVFTSCMRVRQAWEEVSPGRKPHWFGWRRPCDLAMVDSLTVITPSRTLEMVLRRTIMRKEVGELYEALPGLSRTTSLAFLREGGWYPKATKWEVSSTKIAGLIRLTFFHPE